MPVPEQPPPLHPVNVDPAAGVAVRVTTVPEVKEVEQVAGQEMPVGALVTVPVPAPAVLTVSANEDCMKVAVTVVAAFSVTAQVPVPEHAPPHEMPAGALVTVPVPAPAALTVSVKF